MKSYNKNSFIVCHHYTIGTNTFRQISETDKEHQENKCREM